METRVEGPRTPFEVYCHRCRVTFPVGTRRCVHCGGGVAGERRRVAVALPSTHEAEIGEEELPAARGSRISPIAILWLLLAIGGAAYRACASG